jgi:hypothetical protein
MHIQYKTCMYTLMYAHIQRQRFGPDKIAQTVLSLLQEIENAGKQILSIMREDVCDVVCLLQESQQILCNVCDDVFDVLYCYKSE